MLPKVFEVAGNEASDAAWLTHSTGACTLTIKLPYFRNGFIDYRNVFHAVLHF